MCKEFKISKDCQTDRIIKVFRDSFSDAFDVDLVGGAEEPYYQPKTSTSDKNRIIFTKDYSSSALHEVAHWCVAGHLRRKMEDYGYWYAPDGRTPAQQREFELVEVKPQALEWIFSRACGLQFRVSADNISGQVGPSPAFKCAIVEQVHQYCKKLPARAKVFVSHLSAEFDQTHVLNADSYRVGQLN